jgi:DNA-directed RNA polymerase specialized sigma24 family protein
VWSDGRLGVNSVHVPPRESLREQRGLTEVAFSRLLSWLDNGEESSGGTYLEMRRRLVLYFDRRNRWDADELADETLNRIGKTLEATGAIAVTPPARYCYVVARFVRLENFRRQRLQVSIEESHGAEVSALPEPAHLVADEGLAIREHRLDCLERCLDQRKPDQRQLVVDYYRDEQRQIERRRDMASRLGITMNALSIRACRIRGSLEACVESCRTGE